MTARARKVFDSLPDRVLKQIQKLARKSGETPEQIVERAVLLLDQTETKKAAALKETSAANPLADPEISASFREVMKVMGKRSADSLTAAQKTARGEAGAAGRAKKLSPEARKKIAQDAARKRWEKQTKSE